MSSVCLVEYFEYEEIYNWDVINHTNKRHIFKNEQLNIDYTASVLQLIHEYKKTFSFQLTFKGARREINLIQTITFLFLWVSNFQSKLYQLLVLGNQIS